MTLVFNPQLENASLDAIRDAIDSGDGAGAIELYDGATLLATLTLPKPSFSNESGGQSFLAAPAEGVAVAAGQPDLFKFVTSYGTTVFAGAVPADLTVDFTPSGAAIVASFTLDAGVEQAREFASTQTYPYWEAPAPDPLYSSVRMLLNLNGSNGSTLFTDSSVLNRTFSGTGAAQISTAQSVFGGASLRLDGASSVTAPSTPSLNTTNFCIEGWVRLDDLTQDFQAIMAHNTPTFAPGSSFLGVYGNSHPQTARRGKLGVGNFQSALVLASTTVLVAGTWYYFAVTRQNNTVRVFINGILEGEVTGTFGNFDFGNSGTIVGSVGWSTAERLSGYLDDLRYTQATRYTASFTPPAQQFPAYGPS